MNPKPDYPQQVQDHFNSHVETWDNRYENVTDIVEYELCRRRILANQVLQAYLGNVPAQILEVGCGTGRVIASLITNNPTWEGTGIDFADEMIRLCRLRYADNPRLKFIIHDITQEPQSVQYDAIVALGVIGYLDVPALSIDHIRSMLKPGGYFVFTVNKPSIPRYITRIFRSLRVRHDKSYTEINQAFSVKTIQEWCVGYQQKQIYEYSYLPRIPFIRRWLGLALQLERQLGRSITPFSATTMYVWQKD